MDLVPQSIAGRNTLALDKTFANRLSNLGVGQLLIDLSTERDMVKLTLYLQQFGIPIEVLPSDMNEFEFRKLLQNILRIYRLSGTKESIVSLAVALGATSAGADRDAFTLDYTRQATHDALFCYNRGREYCSFAIDVRVSGFGIDADRTNAARAKFEASYRKLFKLFQPVSIHLRNVIFE